MRKDYPNNETEKQITEHETTQRKAMLRKRQSGEIRQNMCWYWAVGDGISSEPAGCSIASRIN